MRSLSFGRPTPAFVLALVALVFAMAGTGYAAATISGKSIQKRTLPANRVVDNALGGRQIDESKLAAVPLATQAGTADSAKTALEADHAKLADKATDADHALKADDADQLGGRLPGAYMRSAQTARSVLVQNVLPGNGVEETASCQSDERLISGGAAFYIAGTNTTVGSATISTTIPLTDATGQITGWRGEGKNTSTVARDFRVFAVCVPA